MNSTGAKTCNANLNLQGNTRTKHLVITCHEDYHPNCAIPLCHRREKSRRKEGAARRLGGRVGALRTLLQGDGSCQPALS